MGGSVSSTARTVTSGDMVVPISQIVDLLRSKLSQSEIDSLLNSLLARTERQVRPGDLITADLMNQVLAELEDLRVRVVQMEGGTTLSGTAEIIEPNPSRTLRIGERLLIVGKGLGTDSKVKIEEALIEAFEPGSDDNLLIVSAIPSVANISETGRLVSLQVNNSRGSPSTKFWLKQAQATIPSGRLVVNLFDTPKVDKFEAGKDYTFTYQVHAVTDLDETYSLNAFTDRGWPAVAVDNQGLKKEPQETFIKHGEPLSAGTDAKVLVKLSIPADAQPKAEAKLQLQVTSKLNPTSIGDTSDPYTIRVAEAPQAADKIQIDISQVKSPGAKRQDASGNWYAAIPTNDTEVQVTFLAQIPQDGNYTVAKPSFKDDPNSLWSARISGANATGSLSTPMTKPDEPFMVYIRAKGSAQQAKLHLEMTCDDDPGIKGSHDQDVQPKLS